MDRSEFLKLIKEAIPDLREAINRQQGLLHLEVDELRKRAQRAIYDGDREVLAICFRLADQAYQAGDRKLRNAIDVSFVEGLEFGSIERPRAWAWEMLPTRFRQLYERFHGSERVFR